MNLRPSLLDWFCRKFDIALRKCPALAVIPLVGVAAACILIFGFFYEFGRQLVHVFLGH